MLHIIAGGGGGALDEQCRSLPEVQVVHRAHHFLVVDAGCDRFTVTAREDGKADAPFDTVVLDPQGDVVSEHTTP
jgi:hypothetical protein